MEILFNPMDKKIGRVSWEHPPANKKFGILKVLNSPIIFLSHCERLTRRAARSNLIGFEMIGSFSAQD
jgi:hypothetical protein